MEDEKTTIVVSKKTKNKIKSLQRPGETEEEVILDYLPEGIVRTFENTIRETPALILEIPSTASDLIDRKPITWHELKNSSQGDSWENYGYTVEKPMYNMDATVMYIDEDSCLLRIRRFNNIYKNTSDEEWFAVYYFF